jgi:hypothetical protein
VATQAAFLFVCTPIDFRVHADTLFWLSMVAVAPSLVCSGADFCVSMVAIEKSATHHLQT